jgi:tetrahydromethanopterin S-methyltransferase subunit B
MFSDRGTDVRAYLFRRVVRRIAGEPREPIQQALDHREPIMLAEPEDRLLDHAYGFVAGISLMGIVAAILILLSWRPTCQ